MKKLLEDLEGQIILNQTEEKTVSNALDVYLKFDSGTKYEKRIQEEIKAIFEDKKSNKSYFFPPPKDSKLKAIGFNQMIHILIKKLWDEEDYFKITRNPSQISFISTDTSDISTVTVSLEDVQKFIANQGVFPFLSGGDYSFFAKQRPDQIRKSLTWIKNGHSIPKYLDRIKLVGTYVQTVFFATQFLQKVAEEYLIEQTKPPEPEIVNTDSDSKIDVISNGTTTEQLNTKVDYPYIVDALLFEIRSLIKESDQPINVQEAIQNIHLRLKKEITNLEEKHVTLIYLLMTEIGKDQNKTKADLEFFFQNLEEKVRIPEREVLITYYLILSERDKTLSEMSVSDFVSKCISEDEKGILTEGHVKILKNLFGSLPKEIKANAFYTVKEKLKARIEDPTKKKIVDTLSELIHVRIRELRGQYALNQLKENP